MKRMVSLGGDARMQAASAALRREAAIKRLTRSEKLALCR